MSPGRVFEPGSAGGPDGSEIHFVASTHRSGLCSMPTLLSDPTSTMYVVFGAMVVDPRCDGLAATEEIGRDHVCHWRRLAARSVPDRPDEREPAGAGGRARSREMQSASQAKKYDDVFKHVSESFKYKSLDKKALRDEGQPGAEQYFPEGIRIWDVQSAGVQLEIDATTGAAGVSDVQPMNSGNPAFRYSVATYSRRKGRRMADDDVPALPGRGTRGRKRFESDAAWPGVSGSAEYSVRQHSGIYY